MKTIRIQAGKYLIIRDISELEKAVYIAQQQTTSGKWVLYSMNFNLKTPVIESVHPMFIENSLKALKTKLEELCQ